LRDGLETRITFCYSRPRSGTRSVSTRTRGAVAAQCMAVQVVSPGQELPEQFTRCIFLAGGHTRTWGAEAVALLRESGLEDMDGGVVVLGDYDAATAAWRTNAVRLADVVLCWEPADSEASDVSNSLMGRAARHIGRMCGGAYVGGSGGPRL